MFNDKVIRTAFTISLLAHGLLLGMPGFNLNKSQPEKPQEESLQIEIEKPPLLPKIDIMGEEKKLKEIIKEELPEPESEPEPQPEEEKIVEVSKPKEQSEIIEKSKPQPSQEIVKVINPQDEAMLRYQDMVKQRIESCRRYPNRAKKQGLEGTVYLIFTILSNGKAENIRIIRSSGFNILDNEAISTVKRASPFPPIPEKFNCSRFKMEVSIVFRLK